jgi:crotonobetainyl-CoA:carnitine CoA-transferase CaiB-like acyl-CoA transferase
MSVLAALVGRDRTGRGRRADVSMLDSLVALLGYDATIFLNTGTQLGPQGNSNVHMVPWAAFPTSDGYVAITARDDRYWRRLCAAIERPELADDPRCLTNPDRVANRDWVVAQLEAALSRRTTAEWVKLFEAFDVPAGPVNDFAGVFDDPQVVARQLVRTYQDPELGPVRFVAPPTRFDDWTPPAEPPPRLGEHTAEVLRDRLGLDEQRIGELLRQGIVMSPAEVPLDGAAAQPARTPATPLV